MEPNKPSTPSPAAGPTPGTSGLAPNVASVLCYLCAIVTGIIFLAIEKNDKEVRFHAWQAIFLGVAAFAIGIATNVLTLLFGLIAGFLGGVFWFVGLLAQIGVVIVWIVAMIKAYNGEHWLIPVIGKLAEQQNNKA